MMKTAQAASADFLAGARSPEVRRSNTIYMRGPALLDFGQGGRGHRVEAACEPPSESADSSLPVGSHACSLASRSGLLVLCFEGARASPEHVRRGLAMSAA